MRRALATRLLPLVLPLLLACQGLGELDLSTLGRGTWQRPDDVVTALAIAPGSRVADLGAGDGYFVPYLAAAVGPEGRVYAVEVEEPLVAALSARFAAERGNVETVLAGYDDPRLPEAGVDLVLLVNTYHHIEDWPAYFARLRGALAPGGRVAVIEPDEDLRGVLGLTLDEGHKSSAPVVRREMESAGYRLEAHHEFLPVQIFSVFAPDGDGSG